MHICTCVVRPMITVRYKYEEIVLFQLIFIHNEVSL
jgi:hypothetical protein